MGCIIPGINNGFFKELASLVLQTEAIDCPEKYIPLGPEWILPLFDTAHIENSYCLEFSLHKLWRTKLGQPLNLYWFLKNLQFSNKFYLRNGNEDGNLVTVWAGSTLTFGSTFLLKTFLLGLLPTPSNRFKSSFFKLFINRWGFCMIYEFIKHLKKLVFCIK